MSIAPRIISEDEAPAPRGLMDYGVPAAKPLADEATVYPEWTMGNVAPAGEAPKVGPIPFDIGQQGDPATKGIGARMAEGIKHGWGDEGLGLYRKAAGFGPVGLGVAAIDAAMRAIPAAIGAGAGLVSGVAEKAGMDPANANKLERDIHAVAQYPGSTPGVHNIMVPGAATFAKMKAGEAAGVIREGAKEFNPIQENALGVAGGKPPKAPLPVVSPSYSVNSPKHLYDIEKPAFEKIGPQKGSNLGGFYKDPQGNEFYIKTPKTADHARNEMLAAKLYQLAGVDVPDLKLIRFGNKDSVVSPIVKGDQLSYWYSGESPNGMGLRENLPIDAWLGNYDVVGTGKDNVIISPDGKAHRIDLGGSLRYRAQGKLKDNFGPVVNELDTMTDSSINKDAADIFANTPADVIIPAVKRLSQITDDQIRELVTKYGPIHQSQKAIDSLANTLIARRDDIVKRFDLSDSPTEPQGGATPPVGGLPNKLPPIHEFSEDMLQAGADKLFGQTRGDPEGVAQGLYDIGKKFGPEYADGFAKKLPSQMLPDVDHYITSLVEATGHDPWKTPGGALKADPFEQRPWTPKEYTDADIAEYEAMQDHQAWKEKQMAAGEVPLTPGATHDSIMANLKPITDWANYLPNHETKIYPVDLPKEALEKAEKFKFNLKLKLFKGGDGYSGKTKYDYPTELMDPSVKWEEPAFFMADDPDVARAYGSHVSGYTARAEKPLEFDWYKTFGDAHYDSYRMDRVLHAAKQHDADLVVIHNIADMHKRDSGIAMQTQYAFLKTENLRAPFADFDPDKLHLRHPLAGLAGGGLFVYGTMMGDQAEAKEPEMQKKASGGAVGYTHPIRMKKGGMLNSSIPGRTDKIPVNVPAGAYVLPADIPSALGEGNSMAGGEILKKMFTSGPYGMKPMRGGRGPAPMRWMSPPKTFRTRAEGGQVPTEGNRIPIIAAGGEYIIHPETVLEIGGGDMTMGHKTLDKFVLDVRKKHIQTLKKLKPPKK